MFRALNRGKHSIVMNLADKNERDFLLSLVPDAHVIIEGFRPGVADRLGVGYDDLVALREDLVYVSINAYGSTGPRASEKGYDTDIRALTGDLHFNRDHNGIPVFGETVPIFDYIAALYAVIGLLTVVLRDGHGPAHLEVPIHAAGVAVMFPRLYEATETDSGQWGADVVLPAADGEYLVALGMLEDRTWKRFCEIIGRPDLGGREELATFRGRVAHATELNEAIAAAIATKGRDEWVRILAAADVPVSPVLDAAEVLADAQVRHLDLIGQDPLSARPPIFGIGRVRQAAPTELDGSGERIRARGWAAVEPMPPTG
jgi:crotonobetainyl-CoA:carnitine CoA-transferase CaiB-like acyl-CoA transferase